MSNINFIGLRDEDSSPGDEDDEYTFESPEQISDQLVTLSLLPNSRWQNLLNLDVIKVMLFHALNTVHCDTQHSSFTLWSSMLVSGEE